MSVRRSLPRSPLRLNPIKHSIGVALLVGSAASTFGATSFQANPHPATVLTSASPRKLASTASAPVSIRVMPFRKAAVSQGETWLWQRTSRPNGNDGFYYQPMQIELASNLPWQANLVWEGDNLLKDETLEYKIARTNAPWSPIEHGENPVLSSSQSGYHSFSLLLRFKASPCRNRCTGHFRATIGDPASGIAHTAAVSDERDPSGSSMQIVWP